MGRKQLTVSIPEAMHRQIEVRVRDAGYSCVSEYFRHLVRHDLKRHFDQIAERSYNQQLFSRSTDRLASATRRK